VVPLVMPPFGRDGTVGLPLSQINPPKGEVVGTTFRPCRRPDLRAS
jgi:hypothetical protein